ncbi:DNA polymerase III subunit gamma/tau [Thiomicrorhabdus indica]|uniref:DNA polymerase III subunit gamma/tau n=1 Tax=Thiomicrorhabdus indica TaxID=2267253 RepID=UPI002AA90728|nr:DNA polymerase III subunit gamma/tau [Thiomicrorhabdus indica]
MSYTVLARKWRPKKFAELVGQQHVMQALANALDQNRLHHAYLFTGTRGVGKTTIARIFAKALNCEQGISSTPCGVCDNCRAIDEGKFIDLIEVDAASKTKVDDTREILDNVQFAATQGRFKVYLIDEVHMLSKSSFNALLKTLEEPPEHVKFILATTDPHKLPITVLSRCLQFNLMRLTIEQIQGHLAYVLSQESLKFEESALGLIAKSADGSARDALSLLDQAIAYSGGAIQFESVQTMLGLVDQQFTIRVLEALADYASEDLKAVIMDIGAMGVDYQALLTQLIEALHAISYHQVFQDVNLNSGLPDETLTAFAESLSAERVQMLYQIALLTKQDMLLSPDIRIGFEMGLMRMLAFSPKAVQEVHTPDSHGFGKSTPSTQMESVQTNQSLSSTISQQGPVITSEKPSVHAYQGAQGPNVQSSDTGANPSKDSLDSGLASGIRPDEPSMIQDMGINDAMSHLSSARSLVSSAAKKKVELSENSEILKTPVEEVVQPQPVNHSEMLQARLQALQAPASAKSDDSSHAKSDSKVSVGLREFKTTDSSSESSHSLNQVPDRFQSQNDEIAEPQNGSFLEEKVDLPWEGESQLSTNKAEDHHLNSLEDLPKAKAVDSTDDGRGQSKHTQNDIEESALSTQAIQQNASQEVLQAEMNQSEDLSQFYDVPWVENSDKTEAAENTGQPVKDSFESGVEAVQETREVATDVNSTCIEGINSATDTRVPENIGFNSLTDFEQSLTPSQNLTKWMQWIEVLKFSGMKREVALNSILLPAGESFNLALMPEHDYPHVDSIKQEIAQALSQYCKSTVEWQAWPIAQENLSETPSQFLERQSQQKLENAKQSLLSDSALQQLVGAFDMQVLENTFSVKE